MYGGWRKLKPWPINGEENLWAQYARKRAQCMTGPHEIRKTSFCAEAIKKKQFITFKNSLLYNLSTVSAEL